jgi:hypothetical protein
MSDAMADPTIDALVPRGSARRNAVLVGLAVLLLAGLWYVPPLLRPALGDSDGGMVREYVVDRQVVQLAGIEPHGTGGVEVRSVGNVSGAHVLGAWVVAGNVWNGEAPATPDGPSPRGFVASLGVGDGDKLPRTVASGAEATLVVLWQVDDCQALTGTPPTVRVATRWGATRDDPVPSPFVVFLGSDDDRSGPCGP